MKILPVKDGFMVTDEAGNPVSGDIFATKEEAQAFLKKKKMESEVAELGLTPPMGEMAMAGTPQPQGNTAGAPMPPMFPGMGM